jgi:hypothetical protein
MDIVKRLRHTEEETATIGQELVYLQMPVNPDGPEAANEIELLRKQLAHSIDLGNSWLDKIERLREALDKYDCSCTEPCALYKMEKERESEMPHMVCGWWASAALKEGE